VEGRLLTGQEAVICMLAEGSCPLQRMQPSTGGRHVAGMWITMLNRHTFLTVFAHRARTAGRVSEGGLTRTLVCSPDCSRPPPTSTMIPRTRPRSVGSPTCCTAGPTGTGHTTTARRSYGEPASPAAGCDEGKRPIIGLTLPAVVDVPPSEVGKLPPQ